MAEAYRLKKTAKSGLRVILKDNFKPYGRRIFLDDATQKQLKYLFELGNPFIEKYNTKEEKEKPGKINVEQSGTDKP